MAQIQNAALVRAYQESRYLRMSSKDMEKSETVKEDKVNHPRHYDLPGGGQTIDVIDDMLDDTEIEGYYSQEERWRL